MERRRRNQAGAVDYRVINGDIAGDPEPQEARISDEDLNAYLTWLANSSTCRTLSALPDVLADQWSLDEALLSPLLLKQGRATEPAHSLSAVHPPGVGLLEALEEGRIVEVGTEIVT